MPSDASVPLVFISHASHDKPLIDLFTRELLDQALGLSPELMFNISSDLSPLEAGKEFSPRIRQALLDCKIVLAFVSESYYRSAFCMAELGAAWITQKLFPVLVPPVNFSSLRGVLSGLQCHQLDTEVAISTFLDEMERRLPGARRRGTIRVNEQIARYTKEAPRVLESIQLNETAEARRGQPVQDGIGTAEKDLANLTDDLAEKLDAVEREWSSGFKQRSSIASQLLLTRAQTFILELLQLKRGRDDWGSPMTQLYVMGRALHKLTAPDAADKTTDLESEGRQKLRIAAKIARELNQLAQKIDN